MKITLLLSLFFTIQISAQQLRCGGWVGVAHYHIKLDLSDLNNDTLYGNTTLFITPKFKNLKNIKLDLWNLQIDKVLQEENNVKFTYNNSVLHIVPEKNINKKDTVKITVKYHGKPQRDETWGGFFITSTHAFNFGIGMAATPPNFGRVWYPCIDNFTDRATYEYSINVKNGFSTACPGTLISVTNNSNNTQTWHWKLHNTIPTYLSSVAVSDYRIITDTINGMKSLIPVEIFINKNQIEKEKKEFNHLKDFLHSFENAYGPYVWEKIGYVSTPFKGGAMEHATNIAYSSNCIGQPNCENTLAHELSHHWFGNLVTCRTEKDMWLNEGWASYSEAIFIEYQYGEKAYRTYNRKRHQRVLQLAHLYDRGYRALYGIPHEYTYGFTVYNKGADVALALRSCLGNTLFFSTLKHYFTDYAFKDISTTEFRNYFSRRANINLNNFFEFWVFGAGFPHFSIVDLNVEKMDDKYNVNYKIYQRLKEAEIYLKSNIEVGYLDNKWKIQKETISFADKMTTVSRNLNFKPLMILIDPDEKMPDATTDEYRILKKTGKEVFTEELFEMEVVKLQDSAFTQITHNWIEPLNTSTNNNEFEFLPRYWQVNYITDGEFTASGKFMYDFSYDYSGKLKDFNFNGFYLLYRKSPSDSWQTVSNKLIIGEQESFFYVDSLNIGKYAIGKHVILNRIE